MNVAACVFQFVNKLKKEVDSSSNTPNKGNPTTIFLGGIRVFEESFQKGSTTEDRWIESFLGQGWSNSFREKNW